ncbi:MAG TPA: ABC transporter permease [Planctomycetota bacterium]|nr:ABC transporter permease [Planctomycetota bacterium]
MMTDFTLIRRSLRARLLSSVLTAFLVALAVALLLSMLSLREASRRAFDRGSGNVQLILSADSSPMASVLNTVFYTGSPARSFKWDAYSESLKKLPLEFAIPVQQGDSYRGFPILSTTPEFFVQSRPDPEREWQLERGAFFKKEFEVVLGSAAAQASGLKPGDQIFLTHGQSDFNSREADPAADESKYPTLKQALAQIHKYAPFTVTGVLKPTGTSHDRAMFAELSSSWIIHAHEKRRLKNPALTATTAADLTNEDRLITGVLIRCKTPPGSSESPVLPRVYDELRRSYPALTVAFPAQEVERLFGIVTQVDSIFLALAVAVLVSGALSILIALYNSMDQRRRQIAILRVIGCSQPRIFGLIVTEAAVIGFIGALAGVILCVAANKLTAVLMFRQLGLVVEPTLLLQPALIVTLAAVFLSALAGLIPAVMAYRTSIVRNLQPVG